MSAVLRPLAERRPDPAALAGLAGIDPVLARIYAARGVHSPDELDPGLAGLLPVGSLDGVGAAVDLLLAHRDRRIVIVGDFDADGATSTALVVRCLRAYGFTDVDYLVPNRFAFGYGLSPEIVRVAAESRPALLVTVDNGISSLRGVDEAARLGMRVLITDHHLPGRSLPAAAAIVNPNLAGSGFGSPPLAGVGVACYLMAALGRRLAEQGEAAAARVPARFLDLVALGTVADVVRLDRNNRILVAQGLRRIRAGHAVPGIRALLAVAGRDPARVVSSDLGFAVGPRLNAAGRLEDMGIGIECLLSDDAAAAARHAERLDAINRERRDIETGMRQAAFEALDALDPRRLPPCVCLYERDWHQGIVGLVAARVRERCHRPAIAFAREADGRLKGSARSIAGVHIRDLLEAIDTEHPGLIDRFGGHAMAAGLSLAEQHFDAFRTAAAECLARLYPDADFRGTLFTDGKLPAEALSIEFARRLREAGPWGAGFPEPLFRGDFVVEEQRVVGERHLKLKVAPAGGGPTLDAIAFNQAEAAARGTVQLAYRLDVNLWRGVETAELVVEQIAPLAGSAGRAW